jgi:hypothetical protein
MGLSSRAALFRLHIVFRDLGAGWWMVPSMEVRGKWALGMGGSASCRLIAELFQNVIEAAQLLLLSMLGQMHRFERPTL